MTDAKDVQIDSAFGAAGTPRRGVIARAEDGRRVPDILIDEWGALDARDGSVLWLGLHEPDEEVVQAVQAQLDCTTSLSRMRARRASVRSSTSTASCYSSRCARRS
jgi:hypothetical protein